MVTRQFSQVGLSNQGPSVFDTTPAPAGLASTARIVGEATRGAIRDVSNAQRDRTNALVQKGDAINRFGAEAGRVGRVVADVSSAILERQDLARSATIVGDAEAGYRLKAGQIMQNATAGDKTGTDYVDGVTSDLDKAMNDALERIDNETDRAKARAVMEDIRVQRILEAGTTGVQREQDLHTSRLTSHLAVLANDAISAPDIAAQEKIMASGFAKIDALAEAGMWTGTDPLSWAEKKKAAFRKKVVEGSLDRMIFTDAKGTLDRIRSGDLDRYIGDQALRTDLEEKAQRRWLEEERHALAVEDRNDRIEERDLKIRQGKMMMDAYSGIRARDGSVTEFDVDRMVENREITPEHGKFLISEIESAEDFTDDPDTVVNLALRAESGLLTTREVIDARLGEQLSADTTAEFLGDVTANAKEAQSEARSELTRKTVFEEAISSDEYKDALSEIRANVKTEGLLGNWVSQDEKIKFNRARRELKQHIRELIASETIKTRDDFMQAIRDKVTKMTDPTTGPYRKVFRTITELPQPMAGTVQDLDTLGKVWAKTKQLKAGGQLSTPQYNQQIQLLKDYKTRLDALQQGSTP